MRKILTLLLLSVFLAATAGGTSPGKISVAGRALSTEGKTPCPERPGHNLMFGVAESGFSSDALPVLAKQAQQSPADRIISASGTDLQGYLKASSSADFPTGWYDINTNGQINQLFSNTAMMGSCGFVRNGRICQFTNISSYGYYWFYYSEYDLLTGEELFEIELPDSDMRNYVINCTYNEDEDVVYMQSYSKDFRSMAWSTFKPQTRERTYLNNNLSWDDNRVVAIAVNPRDDKIYGVKESGDYVSIDRYTGEATKVCTLTVSPAEYSQSMVYAPLEHGFVWSAMLADNTSGFYRIEPETGVITLLGNMAAQNQFLMLYCPDADAADEAPGLSEFSTSFDGPALSGNVTVTMPAVTFGGEEIPAGSQIVAEVAVDGTVLTELRGTTGATVSGNVTLNQGEHNAIVRCRFDNADAFGPELKKTFYVGYDNPLPPGRVRIHNSKISWKAPTGSVHGGYVDYGNIRYTVKLNDIAITSSPIAATEVSFTEPQSLAIYYARVVAEVDGMSSEAGVSPGVKFGNDLEFPFSFTPTAEEFTLFSIVDGNNDGNSWKYFANRDCVYYNSGSSREADEWLLFPLTDFTDANHLYRLSFQAKSLLVSRPEDFEIWLLESDDPTADSKTLIADFSGYGYDQWTDETLKFYAPHSGKFHIAFHCKTHEGFQLMLQAFRGEQTMDTMKAPAECKGVKIESATDGTLQGVASFIAPTKALDGTALDASADITVYARTAGGEGSAKARPGQKGEVRFPCVQGNNRVTLVTGNDAGEGIEKYYEIFAGQEKPGKVQNLQCTVSDDNLSMTITWDPPTEGESGGYINPDDVCYYIYDVQGDELSFLEDIGKQRTYTLTVEPGMQSLQQLAVAPYNVAGASSVDTFRGTSAILGTPLAIPVTETFAWGIPSYLPNVVKRPNSNYSAQWGHGDPTAIVYEAITPDYGCMYAQPTVTGLSLGRVEVPHISTLGYSNVCFRMNAYRFPQGGVIRILGMTNDGQPYQEIGEFNSAKGAKGYVESIFKLPASLQNRPWISIAIEAEFDNESTSTYIIIDDYSLIDLPDNDIALASISGTDRLSAGATGSYKALVLNRGKETMTSSVLWEVLDAEGNVIASDTHIVSPLDPEESEESEFSFNAAGIAMGGCLTVRATAISDPDDTEANNVVSMNVALISAGSGTVSDLRAEVAEGTVNLSWTAPQMRPSANSDFEDLECGDASESLDGWKNLDRDGKEICSIQGVDLPEAGQPKAWQVIDESLSSFFNAHKGSKMLLAMTPSDESAANDWLVSPEIAGNSELVFAANILSANFAEEFQVLVSTTDDAPASFRPLSSFVKNTVGWETYSVALPADARYVAIRYCSIDQFGMMLDDIDFVPADGTARVLDGYNVYRDGSAIGSSDAEQYADRDATGKVTYYVIPLVNENGTAVETLKSNSVEVNVSGLADIENGVRIFSGNGRIFVAGLENTALQVVDAAGRIVKSTVCPSPMYEIPVSAGIYMVSFGNRAVKVIVK